MGSSLVTDEVMAYIVSKYNGYFFTPLDFVSTPDSMWYDDLKQGMSRPVDFWLDSINEQGVWTSNFSWGIDSDVSRQVAKNRTGYVTVKRAKLLLNFDRIEKYAVGFETVPRKAFRGTVIFSGANQALDMMPSSRTRQMSLRCASEMG